MWEVNLISYMFVLSLMDRTVNLVWKIAVWKKMFSAIFVVDTKIIFCYDFVAPLKHETESTINKVLIIMIITDPLRIAGLSYLVCCSCFYSVASLPYQNSWFLLLSIAKFLEKYSQIAIIRSSHTQMFLKLHNIHR